MSKYFHYKDDKVIVDLTSFNNNLSIILPDNEILITKTYKNKILIVKNKQRKSSFIEIDDDNIKKRKKYKLPKKYSPPNPTSSLPFHKVNPEDWRPKHCCQYIRYKYRVIYGNIPLELDWPDKGYTKHSKERVRCWAYAKHLIDKFDRLNLSRKRLKHYIDWCFNRFNLVPTMALLSCNNWIDQYNLENRKKKITNIVEKKNVKTRTKEWEKMVRDLND